MSTYAPISPSGSEQLSPEGPVLVLGRCSTPSGKNAYRLAADDLLDGFNELAKRGLDYRSHLPSKAEIIAKLRDAKPVRSKTINEHGEAKTLANRFVTLDLRQECGVFAIVSAGTGKKLDENLLQPFVTRCAEVAKAIRPRLLFGKSMRRWARDAWGLAPLIQAMKAVPGSSLGDAKMGFIPLGGPLADILAFLTARSGEEEAEALPVQSRRGQSNKTGRRMINGRVPYAAAPAAPPGMACVRLVDGAGVGGVVLVLDTPGCRPSKAEVAAGLPQVFDKKNQAVDQVENVRWALKKLAAGWTHRRIAEGLIARKYSTDGLRRRRGSSAATWQLRHNPINITQTITSRLDVYRTGELHVRLGVDGVDDFVITGCLPIDGKPWASEETFAKIDERFAEGRRRFNRKAHLSLSGLDVTVNGIGARLRSSEVPDTYQGKLPPDWRLTARGGVRVPHRELAVMIGEAVAQAGDGLLSLLEDVPAGDDETLAVRRRITEAEARLAHLTSVCDTLGAQLRETDDEGKPVVTGHLLARLDAEYNDTASDLEDTSRQLEELRVELGLARATQRRRDLRAQTDQLLAIVASLQDPGDLTYRTLWAETIRDLNVEATKITRGGRSGLRIVMTGTLAFSDAGTTYAIPMRHQFVYGNVTRLADRVSEVIDQMTAGIPCNQIRPSPYLLRDEIAGRLGVPKDKLYAAQIDDPLLLRCVMATIHGRKGRSNMEIAEALGVEPSLIDRVEQVDKDLVRRKQILWRQGAVTRRVEQIYLAAAANNGLVRYDRFVPHEWKRSAALGRAVCRHWGEWATIRGVGMQLRACEHCGSYRRARPSLVYMKGLLCLDCLHDSGGVQ